MTQVVNCSHACLPRTDLFVSSFTLLFLPAPKAAAAAIKSSSDSPAAPRSRGVGMTGGNCLKSPNAKTFIPPKGTERSLQDFAKQHCFRTSAKKGCDIIEISSIARNRVLAHFD